MPAPVYIITDSNGFFGQRHMPWEGMDLEMLEKHLGNNNKPIRATWMQLANGELTPRGAILLHSSSQQPEYKYFLDDILLYLESLGNFLIPSIHTTRSHENKGYQELHKRLLGIPSLDCLYFCKLEEIDTTKTSFPAVLKRTTGFGSSGVELIHSPSALATAAKPKSGIPWYDLPIHWKRLIGHLLRKHILRKNNLKPYGSYYSPLSRLVLQQFIPGLECDYKVLTFQNVVYVAKRSVRSKDFRASGSGKISWETPPAGLLDFARNMLAKFAEPYMSFDVAYDGKTFHLIEFQGVHFGPLIVSTAPTCFHCIDEKWVEIKNSRSLEELIGESLRLHLSKTHSATTAAPSGKL